jgi:hypothetical protein
MRSSNAQMVMCAIQKMNASLPVTKTHILFKKRTKNYPISLSFPETPK